jgi:hypothetical protein
MTTLTAPRAVSSRKRSGGWALAAGQGAYALWFAGCAAWAVPRYHADVDLQSVWPWLALLLTAQVGLIISALSLIASGWLLVFGYARGRRGLFIALLGSTLAVLVTIVLALTPTGLSVMGWLLD